MQRLLVPHALPAILILIGTASALDPGLAGAAARHLGAAGAPALLDAPAWSAAVRMERVLSGQGFHRTLNLRVTADRRRNAAGCNVALVQPLPSGLFADPYQLGDVERTRPGVRFTLLGPLDLEL